MKINNNFNYTSSIKPQNTTQGKQVAFSGINAAASDVIQKSAQKPLDVFAKKFIAPVIEKAGNTKFLGNFAKKLSETKFGYLHLMVSESIFVTGCYMYSTAKNKGIKKEQKLPMMINDGLVTTAATVLTYTLDGKIGKRLNNFKSSFMYHLKDENTKQFLAEATESGKKVLNSLTDNGKKLISKKMIDGLEADGAKTIDKTIIDKLKNLEKSNAQVDTYGRGFDKLKSLVIFGMIYRYFSPVLLTPVANKISGNIQHKKKAPAEAAKTPTVAAAAPQAKAPVEVAKTVPTEKAEHHDDKKHDDDHHDEKKS